MIRLSLDVPSALRRDRQYSLGQTSDLFTNLFSARSTVNSSCSQGKIPLASDEDDYHGSEAGASSAEILATKNNDASVVVMVVDRAVHAPSDNNGAGDPRTVIVDVSALGAFSGGTSTTIDANTNVSSGPAVMNITPSPKISVTLGGYGETFLKLKP